MRRESKRKRLIDIRQNKILFSFVFLSGRRERLDDMLYTVV